MTKMKRYRLKIPEMIQRVEVWIANELIEKGYDANDCKPIDSGVKGTNGQGSWCFYDIPVNWLEEIKAKPVSFDTYWEKSKQGAALGISEASHRETWKDSEINNELRHQPKMSVEEYASEFSHEDYRPEVIETVWKFCCESHNWED